MSKVVIFTDLDGTLLDSKTYSYADALEALREIKRLNIPLIIVSSKTRAEIELYRKRLSNTHPFISENGGGIFIPVDYQFDLKIPEDAEKADGYHLIRLGTDYRSLCLALKALKKEGFNIKGFDDMDLEEIMELTGLSKKEAMLCREREFDEPFVFYGKEETLSLLKKRIKEMGFNYTEGRFLHILGKNDKGKAVRLLIDLYKDALGDIRTVGLGDSSNDFEMLKEVDIPVIVMKQDGGFNEKLLKIEGALKSSQPGPSGWNEQIKRILKML